jgi:hypothetical protein
MKCSPSREDSAGSIRTRACEDSFKELGLRGTETRGEPYHSANRHTVTPANLSSRSQPNSRRNAQQHFTHGVVTRTLKRRTSLKAKPMEQFPERRSAAPTHFCRKFGASKMSFRPRAATISIVSSPKRENAKKLTPCRVQKPGIIRNSPSRAKPSKLRPCLIGSCFAFVY